MSRGNKKNSGSSWGMFLSLLLHGTIIVLVLFWGIKHYEGSGLNKSINVSLSELSYKGSSEKGGGSKTEAAKPEKEETKEPEVKKEEKKEEVLKKEEEPKKEEVKKEEKKEKPDKKAVPLEEKKVAKKEKKEEKKKEEKKKEKKKEPKAETKVARSDVINDLKRKNVIENLKEGGATTQTSDSQSDSGGLKGTDKEDVAGSSSRVSSAILNVYNDAIWRKIKPKFRIPPNIPRDGSLTANVYFKIDNNGNVSGVRINKSSGNSAFDNFCINTIISSSPLPPPPKDIAKLVISEGFEIPMSNEG